MFKENNRDRELQAVQAELEAARAELQDTRTELQAVGTELQATRTELQTTGTEILELKITLAQLGDKTRSCHAYYAEALRRLTQVLSDVVAYGGGEIPVFKDHIEKLPSDDQASVLATTVISVQPFGNCTQGQESAGGTEAARHSPANPANALFAGPPVIPEGNDQPANSPDIDWSQYQGWGFTPLN
jgi:hypothetical protein